ncbi:patatin-like phospholipase family protein [Solimicrobium silvestre]|uniref:Putative esterase of the alpha-beta hydrolase superfamily n=1 Tax=Solimicrobium silvestre TaxID=2099400 RepID=A0A2S9GX10_9BURK|nr:patatin-like phospholipase family protein [Solimicrobium silvestre]PRC92238.1 putative esterase of the alpha-beta hydrolase superfamily [Solimicrobium silvestre]
MRRIPLFFIAFVILLLSACKTPDPIASTGPASPVPQATKVATIEPLPLALPFIKPIPKHIKIGLALGGGAARGFAHVGVIKALESQGIEVEVVAGTSAGSLVGALYAAGNDGYALQKIALNMDESTISDWIVPLFAKSTGVLKGEGLQNFVNKEVHQVPIEKLKKTFGAVATDLNTGQAILFRRGNTGAAVRASSAVPGVFQPVKVGDHLYVDGGLVAPVPVAFARGMGADFVIAVNISAQPGTEASASSLNVLMQTFSIMGQTINQHELKGADIVIRPELDGMKGSDFAGRNMAIMAGERAAMLAMPEIKRKIKELQDKSVAGQ